jgi:hypothetical protein
MAMRVELAVTGGRGLAERRAGVTGAPRRRRLLPLALVLLLMALLALPASPARATTRPCVLWAEPTSDRENIIWPEITTTYEAGDVPVVPGGHTEITGEFPHARFFSMQTSGANGRNINGWADYQIRPDRGSTNPFRVGANRGAKHRSYTLRVVDAPVPAGGPAPNTLYSTSSDGTVRSVPGTALVTLRYYLPDSGLGRMAGVPAPTVTVFTPTGQRIPTPTCSDTLGNPGYTETIAATGPQTSVLPGSGPFVAHRVPVWRKFVNAATGVFGALTDNDMLSETVYGPGTKYTYQLPAGFFENVYNKYIATTISMDFGQVLMFRAKLPTTPRTFDGQRRMGTGQLRFWSICTGDVETTMTYNCLVDKDIPIDRQRYFTVAISTAAARPANAIARCAVAWLPAGPPGQTVVILRNMLPSVRFKQAIQNAQPRHERATIGRYYPVGRYYKTTAAFERRGCHRR